MNASDRIKKSHIAIMRHKKFCTFSGLLACGKVEITKAIPTACTNGWDRMYNPDFVDSLNDAELNMLVLHECTHVAYAHLRMWRDLWEENAMLANIAADHFVNLALIDTDAGEGFVKMPLTGVQPDAQYRGMSVRQIFDALKQNPPPQPPPGNQSGDSTDGDSDPGDSTDGDSDPGDSTDGDGDSDPGDGQQGMDSHDWTAAKQQSDAEAAKQGNEVQRALRQGESLRRKLAGKGAGGQDGMFGDLLTPKVDWRKVLRDFITETCAGRDESTWRRPNRRYLAEDIYMPSMIGTTLNELVVGFDTSGSVFGGVEMARFVSEITAIIADINPSKCHVIYWDTDVAGHQVFEAGQFAVQNLKPRGGGGTDGAVLFDYLRAKRINPQAIVQFTDGYVGDWGRSDWPTLWAITTPVRAPYGTSIHIEV